MKEHKQSPADAVYQATARILGCRSWEISNIQELGRRWREIYESAAFLCGRQTEEPIGSQTTVDELIALLSDNQPYCDLIIPKDIRPPHLFDLWTGQRLPRACEMLWHFLDERTEEFQKPGDTNWGPPFHESDVSGSPGNHWKYFFGISGYELHNSLAKEVHRKPEMLYYLAAVGIAQKRDETTELKRLIEEAGGDKIAGCSRFMRERGLTDEFKSKPFAHGYRFTASHSTHA